MGTWNRMKKRMYLLAKTVKKMESSHDLLNELKEIAKEDQKKGN